MVALEDIELFASLSGVQRQAVRQAIHTKRYAKGEVVFYEGEQSRFLYILLEGSVKVYKTSPKGTQIHINRFYAPSLVAEFALFEQEPFPATCEFVTDGAMGLLPFEQLYKLLSDASFSLGMIRSLTQKISVLSALVHQETILSSEAKVADLMLRKASLFHRLKHNEIASIVNLTPETFSRILTKFKKQGWIAFETHRLHILDSEALQALVEHNTLKRCVDCATKRYTSDHCSLKKQ